jgi:hypothetical protein
MRLLRLIVLVLLAFTVFLASVAIAGVNEWTSNGPYGVSITSLAIDPITPTTLYAGTTVSYPLPSTICRGLYKSVDAGDTWYEANTGLPAFPWLGYTEPVTAVFALAIDPTTPTTLYAAVRFAGVFKSVDGGKSWVEMNTGLPPADPMEGTISVSSLAIDPITPTTLYAGTDDGVFKYEAGSSDEGSGGGGSNGGSVVVSGGGGGGGG